MDVVIFPIFFFVFLSGYLLGYFVIFRNWNSKRRADAASCFISLLHGTPSTIAAIIALFSRHSVAAAANSPLDAALLDFSLAFFLTDLLHYLFMVPFDFLFICHHIGTLFVLATCRYPARHGASDLFVFLVLAEITSPVQNVWSLAGIRGTELAGAAKLRRRLSLPFFVFYTITRGILGPIFFVKLGFFYLGGGAKGEIPTWLSTAWIVAIAAGIAGSVFWISNLWKKRFREENDNGIKKRS